MIQGLCYYYEQFSWMAKKNLVNISTDLLTMVLQQQNVQKTISDAVLFSRTSESGIHEKNKWEQFIRPLVESNPTTPARWQFQIKIQAATLFSNVIPYRLI